MKEKRKLTAFEKTEKEIIRKKAIKGLKEVCKKSRVELTNEEVEKIAKRLTEDIYKKVKEKREKGKCCE